MLIDGGDGEGDGGNSRSNVGDRGGGNSEEVGGSANADVRDLVLGDGASGIDLVVS